MWNVQARVRVRLAGCVSAPGIIFEHFLTFFFAVDSLTISTDFDWPRMNERARVRPN